MKVEETEDTAMPLEAIPPADSTTTPTCSPVHPKWDPQDDICAKLFGPWDNLPSYGHINEVRLLRDLDSAIVLFEQQIDHSDAGFHAWRTRHQQAMEAGLAPVPGFPCLQLVRKGKRIWHDEAWEQRYYYLVHQRRDLIMQRLARLLALPRFAQEDFFGLRPAPPRLTLHHGKGRYTRPLLMRCEWWQSLDTLLKAAAEKWDMDEASVKARFWADDDDDGDGDDDASDVELQVKEWGGIIKEEDSDDLRTAEDVFDPREFAASWASEAWRHVQDRRPTL